jgi:AcrR family transcriptional regulator
MKQDSESDSARRSDYLDTRRRMLTAARLILAERGAEAVTISEVAHRADINRSTAYHHFRTRDELLAAVTTQIGDDLSLKLTESQPFWANIDNLLHFFVDHPELPRLMLQYLLSENQIPATSWGNLLNAIGKLNEGEKPQQGFDVEMVAYVLSCIGVMWPLIAHAQFDSAESRQQATQRLSHELKRLLRLDAALDNAAPTKSKY